MKKRTWVMIVGCVALAIAWGMWYPARGYYPVDANLGLPKGTVSNFSFSVFLAGLALIGFSRVAAVVAKDRLKVVSLTGLSLACLVFGFLATMISNGVVRSYGLMLFYAGFVIIFLKLGVQAIRRIITRSKVN